MTEAKRVDRIEEMDTAFDRLARQNGRTVEQEVEALLERKQPLTPQERFALIGYLHGRCNGIQPSLTLDEVREGLM